MLCCATSAAAGSVRYGSTDRTAVEVQLEAMIGAQVIVKCSKHRVRARQPQPRLLLDD